MLKCTLSIVLGVLVAASAAPLKLASGGKALVKIAVAEEQNQFDKFAAEDLQSYLGRMAGAEFAVVKESELAAGEAAIYIGNTMEADKHGLSSDKFEREEWQIGSVDDKSLVVTGGRPIGAFYGVWALLNHLGCYAITWDQDAIPNTPELVYDGFEERRKPAFGGRMIYDGQPYSIRATNHDALNVYYRWTLRNYVNGKQDGHRNPYYRSGVFNISQPLQYHSMERFLPAEKYYKDHPEYYWMTTDGKRYPPPRNGYNGGLCLTNPDVVRLVTENLREMIKADRAKRPKEEWSTVYDISRLDGAPYFCKCPECKKIEDAEGSQQCLLYHFLNAISDEIVKEYPDIIIRTFAWKGGNDNPNRTMPRDNILLWAADNYHKSDCFRPLTHPVNDENRKALEESVKDCKRFMIWDYWNLGGPSYFSPPRVETIFDAIQGDLRYFRGIGATDIFLEASLDNAAPQNFMNLHYFIGNQMMVDPERDAERLADVFISAYYGPNADVMKAWFNELRAGVAAEKKCQPSDGTAKWSYCTPEFLLKSYNTLKAAAQRLPEGSIYRRRTEYEMLPLILSVVAGWRLYEKEFGGIGESKKSLYDEAAKYAMDFTARFGGTEAKVKARFDAVFTDFYGKYAPMPVPEKFKDVPSGKIAVIGYRAFTNKSSYGASVVKDADAIGGKALCSALQRDDYHGAGTVMHKSATAEYRTTQFEACGAKYTIMEAPQDEKYHWYKMEGRADIKDDKRCFWGQA